MERRTKDEGSECWRSSFVFRPWSDRTAAKLREQLAFFLAKQHVGQVHRETCRQQAQCQAEQPIHNPAFHIVVHLVLLQSNHCRRFPPNSNVTKYSNCITACAAAAI